MSADEDMQAKTSGIPGMAITGDDVPHTFRALVECHFVEGSVEETPNAEPRNEGLYSPPASGTPRGSGRVRRRPTPIGQQHPLLRRGGLHSGVASNAVSRARRVHCEPYHGGSARCDSRESDGKFFGATRDAGGQQATNNRRHFSRRGAATEESKETGARIRAATQPSRLAGTSQSCWVQIAGPNEAHGKLICTHEKLTITNRG